MKGGKGWDNFWLWQAAVAATSAACLLVRDPFPLVLVLMMAAAGRKLLDDDIKEKLFLFAFLLRIAVLVLSTEGFGMYYDIPVIYTGGDSESHYAVAEKLTNNFKWSNLWNPPLEGKNTFESGTYHFGPLVIFHTGYVFFLSLFGYLADQVHVHSKYSFIFADAVLGSMIPVLTYDIALRASGDAKIAFRSGLLMTCYPLAIILSGIFLKDSLATFLTLVMVKSLFYSDRKGYLLAGFAWWWLVVVRYKSALFLLPLLLLKWLFPKPVYASWSDFAGEFRTMRVRLTTGVLAVGLAVFTAKMGVISILVRVFISTQEIMERSTVQGLTLMVYGLPGPLKSMGMVVMAMAMPIPPWRCLGVPDKFFLYTFFSDLGALYWYFCIPFILIGLHVVIKDRRHDLMPAVAFSYIIVSMALSYWVDDRRRLMALPFGFILCAIGYDARGRYGYFLAGFAGFIVLAGMAYVVLKVGG